MRAIGDIYEAVAHKSPTHKGSVRYIDKDGKETWAPGSFFKLHVSAAPAAPVAEPLTIQAGRFYKTRDGRKVGPMVLSEVVDCQSGKNGEKYTWSDIESGNTYTDVGRYAWDTTREHENDLVAEWPDTTTNVAATVDALDEEYGPGVAVADRDNDTVGLTVSLDTSELHEDLDAVIAKLKKIRKLQRELGLIAA